MRPGERWGIYNAAFQFVALMPGASFFDSVTSFEMVRGGWVDTVILGAYEVDESGSVANQSPAGRALARPRSGVGGRAIAPHYWVLMPTSLIIFAQNAFCSRMKEAKSSSESLVICWALTFS